MTCIQIESRNDCRALLNRGNEMKFKAVIFDLDGVLCFTDQFHYRAWKKLADEEGIYFDEEINKRLRGVSRMDSLEIILEKADRQYDPAEREAMAVRKNGYYVKLLQDITGEALADGAVETLNGLKAKGLKLAIGSSSKNTKFILEKLRLTEYFDAVSDGVGLKNSKPSPEVFLKAAQMLGAAPRDCLVVEDAVAGIEAAVRGGFSSAAIGDAIHHPNCSYKIDGLKELMNVVE